MAKKKIAVIGQGYVGLELAIAAASSGYIVYGIDISEDRINRLKSGVTFLENVLDEDLKSAIKSNHYIPSVDFQRVSECEVVIICVPTPINESGEPDLTHLSSAVNSILPWLQKKTLVVNESTSYPGTLRELIKKMIEESRPELRGELFFAVAPERVSPGNQVLLRDIPRVIGGIDENSKLKAIEFYNEFCKSVHSVDSPEIAEMSKLLENSFRQINIAFINEFNLICRKLQLDTRAVIEAARTKPYGFMSFDPSAGIGGHCIPVDPMYLQLVAESVSLPSSLIDASYSSNLDHANKLGNFVLSRLRIQKLTKVLLLGVAYKSGLSDTRESPAFRIASFFESRSISVGWIDPLVKSFRNQASSTVGEDWDCALIITNQDELPISELLSKGVPIFDFTGAWRSNKEIIQI